jgi:hypothetical protein
MMHAATRSWRPAVHLHPAAARPGEERSHHQCHRAAARRVQPTEKTQTVLPSADTAAILFWALPASEQITMRKIDG